MCVCVLSQFADKALSNNLVFADLDFFGQILLYATE